ncbi:MAG: APC family permease [Veillonellaceae bacterium]|nr:APC family permease [Veillonellaceae bacterium]
MEQTGYTQELRRVLTRKDLVIYGIAFMTPIAPAYIYGYATAMTGGALALAYIVAMVAMLFTALSYGKMAEAFPVAGSTYSYTQRGINPYLGFFAGWAMFLDYVLVPLIVFMVGAAYAHSTFPAVPYEVWVLLIAAVTTTVNYFGVDIAAKTNLVLVGIMAIIVAVFVGTCAWALTQGVGAGTLVSAAPFTLPPEMSLTALVAGSAIACFSFLGFDSITTMAEEAVHPQRDIGMAAILACVVGGVVFVLQAYVAQLVWPDYTTFESTDTALFEVAQLAGGMPLAVTYTVAVIISTMTAGLAGQSSAARLLYGMGRDGLLPKALFAYLHPKYQTPTYNILIMCVIGVAGALFLDIPVVTELLNFGGLFGFMCVNLAVIVYYYLRQRQRNVVQYLLAPLVGFLVCGYLWVHLSTECLLVGGAWFVVGIVYLLVLTRGLRHKPPVLRE